MSKVADEGEFFEANRSNWDDRAPIHAASTTYDLAAYVNDPDHLSGVVAFDRRYLGDLNGQTAIHLQCHIGTDTVSLARLGAETTGLDQSPESLSVARRLSVEASTPVRFVESTVFDAPGAVGRTFDLVYTGVGALNWLPSVHRWAAVVEQLLAPGGRLYLREGHPMLWAIDDYGAADDPLVVNFPYFETASPMVFDEETTYTDDGAGGDGRLSNVRTYEWNHGLGQIITALLDHGLTLTTFHEHRELEWRALPQMIDAGKGRYRLPDEQADLVPLMYTLIATKPGD